MTRHSLYGCDTPGCDGWKEVITPDGYVCRECAAELETHYEATPELVADGGVVLTDFVDESDIDDGRPDDCDCAPCMVDEGLPCWPCYRDGFREPNLAVLEEIDDE